MIDLNLNEMIKNTKKIAVMLSGGADSAILFYHACDVMSDKTFYPFSGYDTRRPDSIFYAMAVYKFIKENYPNVNIMPHHTFVYTTVKADYTQGKKWDWKKDSKSVAHHKAEKLYWKEHQYDVCLSGMTSNPPEETIKEFKMDIDEGHGVIEPRRSEKRKEWGDMAPWHKDIKNYKAVVYKPFINKDKSYVKMMYEKYDVLDTLFPLTASCIGWPRETDNGRHPCRICVWCKERLWAFGSDDFLLDHEGWEFP
jgi:hypothetical protein